MTVVTGQGDAPPEPATAPGIDWDAVRHVLTSDPVMAAAAVRGGYLLVPASWSVFLRRCIDEAERRGDAAPAKPEGRVALSRAIAATAERYPHCRCELNATMTNDELVALGAGCTAPVYTCPRLDVVRRRVR